MLHISEVMDKEGAGAEFPNGKGNRMSCEEEMVTHMAMSEALGLDGALRKGSLSLKIMSLGA